MYECLLCKRNMKVSKDVFGNGCVRNIYSFLDLKMPKKVNLREKTLYNNIMQLTNTKNINTNQKIWLTDRYLTYQYLNKIPYGNYNIIKNQINYDIQNIKQTKKDEEPKSAKIMSLKQAYDLYKKVIKFQDGIDKISNGNLTDEDSIKPIITSISFIFNLTKNKKQYEKNTFKGMQFVFWQTVIEVGGKYAEFPISADFLQHSLEKEPENLVITEGKVIKEITEDKYFQENINNIVKKYGNDCNEFTFDSKKDDSFPMNFNDKDLYFSIHSANLYIKGKKNTDKWNLEITLHDKYDYSQPKNLLKYYNDTSSIAKSLLSSTLYNFASLSVHNGVIKEYDIDIKISIDGVEVK